MTIQPKRTLKTLLFAAFLVGAPACSDESSNSMAETSERAMRTYAEIVHASYDDSLILARAMDEKIRAFVQAPTAEGLKAAQQAWLDAREPYLQTEVYRFYGGPIDHPQTGPEGLINAWPLDEKFIDYVQSDPNAGIVNRKDVVISAQSLLDLNESQSEENISVGFHAIEFLLWGQDNNPNGPGQRPHTDYLPPTQGGRSNHDRRGQYLLTVSSLLVSHLDQLTKAWAPQMPGNYRSTLVNKTAMQQLQDALTGMIILTGFETGGERIGTALESGEQEDEHSCFSDNTHRDMVQDVQGIWNVWNGQYRRLDGRLVSGAKISEVVRISQPELAAELDARIVESLNLAKALRAPFDQEILPSNPEGRARVKALEASLWKQRALLEKVFLGLGLVVPQDPM